MKKKLSEKQNQLARALKDGRFNQDVTVKVKLEFYEIAKALDLETNYLDEYLDCQDRDWDYNSGIATRGVREGNLDGLFSSKYSNLIKMYPQEAIWAYEDACRDDFDSLAGSARREHVAEILKDMESLNVGPVEFLVGEGYTYEGEAIGEMVKEEAGIVSVESKLGELVVEVKNLHYILCAEEHDCSGHVREKMNPLGVHDEDSLKSWMRSQNYGSVEYSLREFICRKNDERRKWPEWDICPEPNPDHVSNLFGGRLECLAPDEWLEGIEESVEEEVFESVEEAAAVVDEWHEAGEGTWLYRLRMKWLVEAGQLNLFQPVAA